MLSETFSYVVMQPCTICNLDCTYCYLLTRKADFTMDVTIARRVANAIKRQNLSQPVSVIWHGGEPLATGRKHFQKLLQPFEKLRKEGKVVHYIQTNGTLINKEWCKLFKKHQIQIGVSIDGDQEANRLRVDWTGKSVFNRIMNGINFLKQEGIPFTALAVVSDANISDPSSFYEFFSELGCESLGINIEEKEGGNLNDVPDDERVSTFWRKLFQSWRTNPMIKIREINRAMTFAHAVITEQPTKMTRQIDPFPTVAHNGDVVVLSPEFAGIESEKYSNFVLGNLLANTLEDIINRSSDAPYVMDFIAGIEKCQAVCPYFDFCYGGQASNKFFEHGTTDATETAFCRNVRKRLLDVVIDCV